MAMDTSLFSSLNKAIEEGIFVVEDYALIDVGFGRIECQNGVISDVYHVLSLSVSLLSIAQLTQIGKKVENSNSIDLL